MLTAFALKVLGWVLPIVLGPVVYYVAREVLNVSRRVDDLPAPLKRVAVVLIAAVVTAVFNALGIVVPEACTALTEVSANASAQACALALTQKVPVQAVTAAVVAMIIHAVKKQRPNE